MFKNLWCKVFGHEEMITIEEDNKGYYHIKFCDRCRRLLHDSRNLP